MERDKQREATLKNALSTLLSFEGRKELRQEHFSLSDISLGHLERIFSFAHQTKLVIDKGIRPPINAQAADSLNNALTNAQNEINAFISNGNAAHIDNARNHIDGSADHQLRLLIPIGFETHPRTEAALESYRNKAREANLALTKEIKDFRAELGSLQDHINGEGSKVAALEEQIATLRSDNESLLNELRKADIERVESHNRLSQEALAEAERRLTDFMTKKEKSVNFRSQEMIAAGDALVDQLTKKKEEASSIVQSVGDILTTGTYADRATTETQKADTYRRITVGLFAFGLFIIVSNYLFYAIGWALGAEVELAEAWQSLGARIATGLAVTLPAFYTARESARHRTNADIAKQRELELTTLGPFIELLPEETKSSIRDRLTDRYFGGDIDPHEIKPPIDLDLLAKSLVELSKRTTAPTA
jgi:hypothetical protein